MLFSAWLLLQICGLYAAAANSHEAFEDLGFLAPVQSIEDYITIDSSRNLDSSLEKDHIPAESTENFLSPFEEEYVDPLATDLFPLLGEFGD